MDAPNWLGQSIRTLCGGGCELKKIGAVFLLIEIAVLAFAVINTAFVPDRPNMDAIYLNTEPAFILQEEDSTQGDEASSTTDSLVKLQSVIASLFNNFSHSGRNASIENRAKNTHQGQAESDFAICPYAKNCHTLAA